MPRIAKFNPMEYATEILQSQINPLDPIEWCKNKAGIELWSKQREIAQSIQDHKLTAVQSGHGVGKSYVVSALATWWVDTHPPDETMVVSTAPSTRQVSAIMWEGIRGIHRRAKLRGEVQRSDRWLIDDIEVGFGRKPQDYDQYAFQGIHRKYVLVIIDEAGGIDEWLWIAALAIATGKHCRIVAIGNPEDPTSYFSKVCKPGSGWNTIHISVFDSPNFTGEQVSEDAREKLTDSDWVDSMRREVGEDSPMWTSKVLGEFPEIDQLSCIPLGWIYRAQERWQEWNDAGAVLPDARYIIGADIARYGGDKSAFAHRCGHVFTHVEVFPGGDTERTADMLIERLISGNRSVTGRRSTTVVDTNGIGAGVFDKVRRRGYSAVPLNVANRSSTKDTSGQIEFYNLRAAAVWKLREALDPARNPTLCLPVDDKLATDLSAARWSTNRVGGKLVIEDKKDIRKRIGRSPDAGDAVVLAHWITGEKLLFGNDSAFDWKTLDDSPSVDGEDDFGAVAWEESDDDWRLVSSASGYESRPIQ